MPLWLLVFGCHSPEKTEVPSESKESVAEPLSACGPVSTTVGEPALQFSGAPPVNLLVISIDTLRRDRVGHYNEAVSTPFLDGLLGRSVVLEDARSCSNWTYPSMTCIMTGQSTLELGVEPLFTNESTKDQLLPLDLETLATWLTAAGWQSTLVTTAGLFSDQNPMANGFQRYEKGSEKPADWLVRAGTAAYQELDPTKKWYLHLHFRDPHSPYDPPVAYQGDLAGKDLGMYDPRTKDGVVQLTAGGLNGFPPDTLPEVTKNVEQLYRGEVAFLDDQLALLWDTLEAAGALENTLVVLIGDHGEQLFDHGRFQHAMSLHAEEGRVIGGFWAKNLAPMSFSGMVSHPDIAPTILHALGVEIPASVTGQVVGTAPADRLRVSTAVEAPGIPVHVVERNGFRLMYSWSGERHLYRYDLDPMETEDLYDSQDENVKCLWDFLRPDLAKVDAARAGMTPVDPE